MATETAHDGRHYINGNFVESLDGERFDVMNPATGEVAGTIARGKAADMDAAVAAAKAAFHGEWRKLSASERADLLDKIADGIEARKDELARLESEDTGKTLRMASTVDIPRAIANFRFFAGQIRHDETGCHVMKDAINYTLRVPVGVVGLVTPWNLPLYLLSWKVAPALCMGNCVVAKPSELTPRTAGVLAEIINSVPGIPPGVFNLVHGFGAEAGARLVEHPDVRALSFTGGTVTGARVAAVAAPMFKKLSLELGGKNSTIIFADADFDTAVNGALRSAFTNQGQVCLAGSRILVQRSIHDQFVDEFRRRVGAMVVGDPLDDATAIGPVSSLAHREKVESYVKLAREEGGEVTGGERPAHLPARLANGAFLTPCVVTGLPHTARCSNEEVFGPFVTIHAFDTEEEAVEMANSTPYGLAGSVWTRDLGRAHRVCAAVESGILWVNTWLYRDLRTPFGGVKASGIGREGGKHSLEFFGEFKNVCVHTHAM
mmetsp:Transcript_30559/g.99802  ORF Transcript_30559/g.99802 Transcript_30559/m.99802 type:complete len:490 (-) Transcript_30559:81-1550(-)